MANNNLETKFITLDKDAEEADRLRSFLKDIPNWDKSMPSICIDCDNQSAVGRANSKVYNGKSRHIHRRHKTVRRLLSNGVSL